jgi:hypothetical protein
VKQEGEDFDAFVDQPQVMAIVLIKDLQIVITESIIYVKSTTSRIEA